LKHSVKVEGKEEKSRWANFAKRGRAKRGGGLGQLISNFLAGTMGKSWKKEDSWNKETGGGGGGGGSRGPVKKKEKGKGARDGWLFRKPADRDPSGKRGKRGGGASCRRGKREETHGPMDFKGKDLVINSRPHVVRSEQ